MVVIQPWVKGRGCTVSSKPKLWGYTLYLGSSLPLQNTYRNYYFIWYTEDHKETYKVLSNVWRLHINNCESSSFTERCNLSSKIILTTQHRLSYWEGHLSKRPLVCSVTGLVNCIHCSVFLCSVVTIFSSSPNGTSSVKYLINPNTCLHSIYCDMDNIHDTKCCRGTSPGLKFRGDIWKA